MSICTAREACTVTRTAVSKGRLHCPGCVQLGSTPLRTRTSKTEKEELDRIRSTQYGSGAIEGAEPAVVAPCQGDPPLPANPPGWAQLIQLATQVVSAVVQDFPPGEAVAVYEVMG